MNEQTTITPAKAAELVGVEVYTIRRWCDWHEAHLSPGASPGAGALRRLTMRDIEVLKTVRDLRAQGLTTATINEQLAGLTFPEIEEPGDQGGALTAPPAAQEGPGAVQAPLVVGYDLERLVEALEQSRRQDSAIVRSGLTMFGLGFCAACLLFFILVYLAALYAK